MSKFLAKRLLYCIFVLLGVSMIVFLIIHLSPGDPVLLMVPETATDVEIEAMREKMGYNKPIAMQYLIYLNQVMHGDLGKSLFYKTNCAQLVFQHLGPTALLTASGLLVALLVGIPLGVFAGIKRGSLTDMISMFFAMIGQSMSPVWLGILLIFTFSVKFDMLPSFGYGSILNLILPSITLGLPLAALIARLTRAGMVDVLTEDYTVALRSKGVPEKDINFRYALKNVLIPIVNVVGVKFGTFLGGAVVNETIFAWPGIGLLAVNAILSRDYPLVQATILVVSALFVIINMLVDILSTIINPKMDLE